MGFKQSHVCCSLAIFKGSLKSTKDQTALLKNTPAEEKGNSRGKEFSSPSIEAFIQSVAPLQQLPKLCSNQFLLTFCHFPRIWKAGETHKAFARTPARLHLHSENWWMPYILISCLHHFCFGYQPLPGTCWMVWRRLL